MDFFNSDIFKVVIRCIAAMTTLFFMTKLLGKKQVSELSLFDYVVGISIGNFASEMAINLEAEFFNSMLAIIVFGILAYFISILTTKSLKLRKFFVGTPTVLMENSKLIYKNITVKDMKLKIEKQGLCANVIIDGNIMDDNLINIGKDTEWLLHELKCKGKQVHDILLATVDINDKLTLYERLPYMESNKILE